jgi:hypothetical protein
MGPIFDTFAVSHDVEGTSYEELGCQGKYAGYCRPSVTAQNSRYDRFPPAANYWRNIQLVPGNDPTTPG